MGTVVFSNKQLNALLCGNDCYVPVFVSVWDVLMPLWVTHRSVCVCVCVEETWRSYPRCNRDASAHQPGANALITSWLIRWPRGQSLKRRPLHIPALWLRKINQNHSSNLVPSKRLQFFFPLFQTWHQACSLSSPTGCWALELGGILRSAQSWAHFLFTYSPLQLVWVRRPGEEVNGQKPADPGPGRRFVSRPLQTSGNTAQSARD